MCKVIQPEGSGYLDAHQEAPAPNFRIVPKEHFWIRGLKREFELSVLVPMYLYISNNIEKIEKHVDQEFTIGRSTVKYSVTHANTIHLISGWVGNRKNSSDSKDN